MGKTTQTWLDRFRGEFVRYPSTEDYKADTRGHIDESNNHTIEAFIEAELTAAKVEVLKKVAILDQLTLEWDRAYNINHDYIRADQLDKEIAAIENEFAELEKKDVQP